MRASRIRGNRLCGPISSRSPARTSIVRGCGPAPPRTKQVLLRRQRSARRRIIRTPRASRAGCQGPCVIPSASAARRAEGASNRWTSPPPRGGTARSTGASRARLPPRGPTGPGSRPPVRTRWRSRGIAIPPATRSDRRHRRRRGAACRARAPFEWPPDLPPVVARPTAPFDRLSRDRYLHVDRPSRPKPLPPGPPSR